MVQILNHIGQGDVIYYYVPLEIKITFYVGIQFIQIKVKPVSKVVKSII